MTKYEIILYWSSEDGAFIAEVPELAGCAADGATRQEALANAEVVIAEWLETARELGRPIPEPKGHSRLPERSGVLPPIAHAKIPRLYSSFKILSGVSATNLLNLLLGF